MRDWAFTGSRSRASRDYFYVIIDKKRELARTLLREQ